MLLLHQALPLEKTKDSDDDVKGIETGLEGNILIEVEDAGDDIDGNPNEPLLEVLVCQSPDTDEAEGGGKTVGKRHITIGERH